MAEIGVIASIIGIAGVGIKLSKALFEIGEKAVSVDKNLYRLATNVALFSQTLRHFAEVMRVSEELYSYEFEETASQIITECESIFEDLTKRAVMARGGGGPGQSPNEKKKASIIIQRVRSYFEQSRVDWLLAQLEYLKTTLSVLIQTLQLAAVTAKAKQNNAEDLSQQFNEAVEREKVHIETLIIARQLSILVVLQQAADQQQASGHAVEIEEEWGSVSPAESDEPREVYEQKLLTESPSESSSLVHLGRSNLKFLDDAIDRDEPVSLPALSPGHSQIIDQLLGRWTRLPQLETEINEAKAKSKAEKPTDMAASPVREREMEMLPPEYDVERKGSLPAATDLKLPLISDSGPATMSAPEVVAFPYLTSQNNKNLDPSAMQSKAASRAPQPPPLATHVTDPLLLSSMSNASLDDNALARARTSPGPEKQSPRQARAKSPQPNYSNSVAGYSPSPSSQLSPSLGNATFDRNLNQQPKPRRISFTSAPSNTQQSGRPGSSHQTGPRNLYPSPTSPRNSVYSSSPDSDVDDDGRRRLGLGIPWRIVIGPKYWDFLDERLVGPRKPYLPTEPMAYLYSHDFAETEIAEQWVCEEAVAEKNYKYLHLAADEEDGPRWRIKTALKYNEVDSLVERTIDMFRRKKTASQPAPTAARNQPPAPPPAAPPVAPGPAYAGNGPMPIPPVAPVQDPGARARVDNFNTWQQMSNPQQMRAQQAPRGYPAQEPAWMPPPPPLARNVHFGPGTAPNVPPSSVAGNPASMYGPPWQGYQYPYPPPQMAGARGYEPDPRHGHDRHDEDTSDHGKHHKRRSRDKKKRSARSTATAAKVSGLMAVLDSLDAF